MTIKLDFAEKRIIIGQSFSVRAASVGSKEYVALTDTKQAYPDFDITIRASTQPQRERYKGLKYEYMEYYISTHDNATARMEEYRELRQRAECHTIRYSHIKKWFLTAYPQIDDFTPEDFANSRSAELAELIEAS